MGSPWEKHGDKQSFVHPDVLGFKVGMTFNVRVLTDTLPEPSWYHATQSQSGSFLKAACTGSKQGCKMCQGNAAPEYAKAKNQDKPYPLKMEYVGPVFVVQTGQVKLLAGKQVWDRIAEFGKKYMTLLATELEIELKNNNGMKEYSVTPYQGKPALTLPSGATVPDPKGYLNWILSNVERVASLDQVLARNSEPAAPAAASPTYALPTSGPSFAPPPPAASAAPVAAPMYTLPATAPVAPVPAPAAPAASPAGWGAAAPVAPPPAAASSPDEEEKKALRGQFMQMTRIWYAPAVLEEMLDRHGKGRQLEQKTKDELMALNGEYVQKIAALGPDYVQKLKDQKLVA